MSAAPPRGTSSLAIALQGLGRAASCGKVLLLALGLNLALALTVSLPVTESLHRILDRSPLGERLAKGDLPLGHFWQNLVRVRPDLLGDLETFTKLLAGEPVGAEIGRLQGVAGSLVWAVLLHAVLQAFVWGGLSGRLAAPSKERGDLAAFASDAARLGPASLVLSILSLAATVGAYRLVFVEIGTTYRPAELTYEFQAVALLQARLWAAVLVAGLVRLWVAAARAALGHGLGLAGAAGRATGLLLAAPVRAVVLGVSFLALGLVPLALGLIAAPALAALVPSTALGGFAGVAALVALQQACLLARLWIRAGLLGAFSSWDPKITAGRGEG